MLVLVQRVLVLVLVRRLVIVRRLRPVLKLRTLMQLPWKLIGTDLRPMLVQWRGPMRPKRVLRTSSRPPTVGC
jgi:hypothetical protein